MYWNVLFIILKRTIHFTNTCIFQCKKVLCFTAISCIFLKYTKRITETRLYLIIRGMKWQKLLPKHGEPHFPPTYTSQTSFPPVFLYTHTYIPLFNSNINSRIKYPFLQLTPYSLFQLHTSSFPFQTPLSSLSLRSICLVNSSLNDGKKTSTNTNSTNTFHHLYLWSCKR